MKLRKNKILRIFVMVFCFVVLLFCLLPIFVHIINMGSIVGIVAAVLGIIWSLDLSIMEKIKRHKVGKAVTTVISVIIIIALVYGSITSAVMVVFSARQPADDCTLIVLGCKVDGTNPSLMLTQRLNAADDYLNSHPEAKCIVSGGQGNNENISEAQCMYNYLTEKGISPNRIYMENRSTDTNENIRFSKEIIEKNNLSENIGITSDGFHELRASIIAYRSGFKKIGAVSAKTPLYLLPAYWIRELVAIPAEIIGL